MKPILHTIACLSLSSLCHAEEPEPKWVLPEIRDGVANLIEYDQNEFVAMKFLCRIQSGMKPTETNYMPILTDEGIDNARFYLLKKRFNFPRNDEFKQKRANEKLDAILKSGSDPFRTIDAVTHIRIDLTEYVVKNYDFAKSTYPFRPDPRGFTAQVSLYDESQPFEIEVIRLDQLPIEPELAEQWKTGNGRLTGLFRLGKGFSARKHFPSMRAVCEKIEFRTRDGELMKEVTAPPALRDINKDYTMEETMNIDYLKEDEPEEQIAKSEKSSRLPTMGILTILLIGGGFIAVKIRSSKAAKRRPSIN
jgi:hypothetical protein